MATMTTMRSAAAAALPGWQRGVVRAAQSWTPTVARARPFGTTPPLQKQYKPKGYKKKGKTPPPPPPPPPQRKGGPKPAPQQNTKQAATGQGQTKQPATGQEKPKQPATGQDKSKQPATGQDKSKPGGTKPGQTKPGEPQAPPAPEQEEHPVYKLRVNRNRLMHQIHHTSHVGASIRWGISDTQVGLSRIALADEDRDVRTWFEWKTKQFGCTVTVDAIGNMFAVRPGRKEGAPTYMGSHFDTHHFGGRYSGVLGIHAGVEILNVLHENNIETEYPVGLVNWTNKEGVRFPYATMGSAVWAGELSLEDAYNTASVANDGTTVQGELMRIGWLGKKRASYKSSPMAAYFELYIEQGPLLEAEKKNIGIVQSVQATKWYTIDIVGQDGHTGTTPMKHRSDALVLASAFVSATRYAAEKLGMLATVPRLSIAPAMANTVPCRAMLSLDLRASSLDTVEELERELRATLELLPKDPDYGGEFKIDWEVDRATPDVQFHPDTIACVREAAAGVMGPYYPERVRDMSSVSAHDGVNTSKICPTSMIFIPCRGGITHNPRECAEDWDCTTGSNVLLQTILRWDRSRKA